MLIAGSELEREEIMAITKVLWIVDMDQPADETRLLQNAKTAGAQTVCIRTTSQRLPGAIGRFHAQSIKVYAWRWPAVRPTPASTSHYYAMDEAGYVAEQLIPAGLDGYIVDPESENDGKINDWNDTALAGLARDFCQKIKAAAPAGFHFGITSGCAYPSPNMRPEIPWAEFVAASDALYPQTYWQMRQNDDAIAINGGTPDKAIDRGLASWKLIAAGKPIVPMAGELDVVGDDEIGAYAARLRHEGVGEAHFYADSDNVAPENYTALATLDGPGV
jgi:hypothetical protein